MDFVVLSNIILESTFWLYLTLEHYLPQHNELTLNIHTGYAKDRLCYVLLCCCEIYAEVPNEQYNIHISNLFFVSQEQMLTSAHTFFSLHTQIQQLKEFRAGVSTASTQRELKNLINTCTSSCFVRTGLLHFSLLLPAQGTDF